MDGSAPDGAVVNNFQSHASGVVVLDGEGAYEGLSVVLDRDGLTFGGFIAPTEVVPPTPGGDSTVTK